MQAHPTRSELTDLEWAWLAGLFEGEGNIHFHGKTCVRLMIKMTDRDVLETVDRLIPSPSGLEVIPRGKWKTCYCWSLNARDKVRVFLEGVLPYLHERRGDKARAGLLRLEQNRSRYLGDNTHCKRGHLYTPESIYTDPRGKQTCQICMRERNREWKRRAKAARVATNATA